MIGDCAAGRAASRGGTKEIKIDIYWGKDRQAERERERVKSVKRENRSERKDQDGRETPCRKSKQTLNNKNRA